MYTLQADGSLKPGPRVAAAKVVMPMAVSPDKRFLIAAVRSKPYEAYTYSIDKKSGALKLVGKGPLAESYPYIAIDRIGPLPARRVLWRSSGRGESDRQGRQGRRADPGDPDGAQRARDPHRQHQPICVRAASRHRPDLPVRVRQEERQAHREHAAGRAAQAGHRAAPPHRLEGQQVRLSAQRADRHGDHAVARREDRDAQGARLRVRAAARHQARPRRAARRGRRARRPPPRNTDNDIWASDLHLTPNGRFLYAAERTSSTLGAFRVDAASGKLTYLGSTPTEKQPRGFAIDPTGRFVVVSGEKSDTISSYAIDAETGALKPIGRISDRQGLELGRDRLVLVSGN